MILIVTFAFFTALFFLGFFVNHGQYKEILYITPNTNHASDASLEEIEKINEEDFLTTYTVEQEKKIKAIHGNHIVNLRGTNYSYPFVLNYNLIKGGFFTKSAQEQKHKVVVLNEIAAFELFGGNDCIGNELTMDGYIYTVVGVLDDEDEDHKNIYVPITFMKELPNEFISRLSEDVSEEYVKTEYKNIGITTDYYQFINIGLRSKMIQERAVISCILILIVILIWIMKFTAQNLQVQYSTLGELLKQHYLRNIVISEIKFFALFIGKAVFIVLLIPGLYLLGTRGLEIYLSWRDLSAVETGNIYGSFINHFDFIETALFYSNIFFVSFLILLLFTTILIWNFKFKNKSFIS